MGFSEIHIPSVSEASILVGAYEMIPEIRKKKKWDQFQSAISAGVMLDDCIDFVHHNTEGSIDREKYLKRYETSAVKHIARFPNDANFFWFLDGVIKTEGAAMGEKEPGYWTPESVKAYRESPNAIWAIYIGSLFDDKRLDYSAATNLNRVKNVTELATQLIHQRIFDSDLAELVKKRMFFGSMLFQVVSDYEKREFATEHKIPSFGGIGFEEMSKAEVLSILDGYLSEYMNEAQKVGMNKTGLALKMKLLKISKKIPKK